MYWEYILMGVILIPGIIFAIVAQSKVNSTYNKYSKVLAQSGVTATQAARRVLDAAGLENVAIKTIEGKLTDYYSPKEKVVALSQQGANSASVAALGIALHEVGHAIQHEKNYFPLKFRNFVVGLSNVASKLLWPIVIVGLLLNFVWLEGFWGDLLLWAGVGFFGLAVVLNLATIPVEYNASNRALAILKETKILNEQELPGCKKVLRAAGLTYVAALVMAVLNLFRFLLIFIRRDD